MREDLEATFDQLTKAHGFTKEADFSIRSFDEGRVVLEAPVTEKVQQFMGFVHAGVVAGIADHAAGAAYTTVLPEGHACVTIELKINYLKPAIGERIIADAKVIAPGKSIGVVSVETSVEKEGASKLCSVAIVTLKATQLS
ncbi:MAG: PaaI family thioesterase [Pseudomonadota bacterium]